MRHWVAAGGLLALGMAGCTPAEVGGGEAGADVVDATQPVDVLDAADAAVDAVDTTDVPLGVDAPDAADAADARDGADVADVADTLDAADVADAADAPADDGLCPDGTSTCGTACVDTQTDPTHCGASCTACTTADPNAHPTCNAGACGAACNAGFTSCGGPCVSVASFTTDVHNCGACGHDCTSLANAGTGAQCVSGACVFSGPGACVPGFAHCGADPDSGCNTSIHTNTDCGACGVACTGGTCTTGTCVCPLGQTLCGTRCVSLQTDVDNCGACGYAVVSAGRTGEPSLRSCVGGQPSPGWVPITNVGAPNSGPTTGGSGWTGRHFLFMTPTQGWLYDPGPDRWTALTEPLPFTADYPTGVAMPDRNQLLVYPGTPAGYTNQAYLFDDSGATPHWVVLTTAGAGQARGYPSVVYDGARVWVLWGYNATHVDDGAVYDLATSTWTGVAAAMPVCSPSATGYQSGSFGLLGQNLLGFGYVGWDGTLCNSTDAALFDVGRFQWGAVATSVPHRLEGQVLSLGDAMFVSDGLNSFGGTNNCYHDAYLVNQSGSTAVNPAPTPSQASYYGLLAYTGRAIISWGGTLRSWCSSSNTWVDYQGGSIGAYNGSSIAWRTLPTSNQPPAQSDLGLGVELSVATQELWTGREAIVFGGSHAADGTPVWTGARYQPPVGCVCPRNAATPPGVADGCSTVATSTIADSSCTPR